MSVHPSDSSEQRRAGEVLIQALSSQLGIQLKEKILAMSNDCLVEIDGYSENPPILCEAWVHYGKPRGAQYNKIMKDAFKMLFVEKDQGKKYKKILLFCDEDAQKLFTERSWQAQCLRLHDIETKIHSLPKERETRIKKVQKRQFR